VYFRSDKYPDFYYVEMTGNVDDFEAVLPIPSEETDEVIYYVEAVSRTFDMARTPEHDPIVASDSECRRRDAAALWWTGGDPGIVVGATVDGAPAMPPGFQVLGITGLVSAAGALSSTGGGIGAGAAIGVGAGAAAAAGVGIAVAGGGDSSTTTTTVIAGGGSSTTTTTAAVTSTTSVASANEAPVACFTMDPADGNIEEGETLKLDARCSQGDQGGGGDPISFYEWDLGDGRFRSGADQAFITPRWTTPGEYTVTLTVTDSGGASAQRTLGVARSQDKLQASTSKRIKVRSKVKLQACFNATSSSWCSVQFDASCSTPDDVINRYDWVLDEAGTLQRVERSGKVVSHTWSCWMNENITVKLTVSGRDGQQTLTDTISRSVTVVYFSSPFLKATRVTTSFASYLGIAPFDGRARGQVTLNGTRTDGVDSSSPFQHRAQGRFGENTIEAHIPTPTDQPGFWRFDFGGAEGFVVGSIKVRSGQVTSIDSRSVVFRVSGAPGERIKFTFELLP
jgi:PKD repeat protein